MIRIGITGGAGYTAGELIRLLLLHPEVSLSFVNSASHEGKPVSGVHGLTGDTDLVFSGGEMPLDDIDLLFFCNAHGDTRKWMETHRMPTHLKAIDLTADYRIASPDNNFVYGLPELNRNSIRSAQYVANPGCFATCIQLAALPLAANGLLNADIHVTAVTGSTGAGAKP